MARTSLSSVLGIIADRALYRQAIHRRRALVPLLTALLTALLTRNQRKASFARRKPIAGASAILIAGGNITRHTCAATGPQCMGE